MSEISFAGKVAVVSGAGRGLGRAYARLLASRGASVVVNDYNVAVNGAPGDPGESPAETVAAELRASGAKAVSNADSIGDPDGAARIIQQAVESFGRLDILINNAGVGMCDNVQDEPGPLYDVNMNTTLRGTVLMTRAAWPHLVEQENSRVLNVSSAAIFGSHWPDGGVLGAYALAKAGIFAYTRQIGSYGEALGVKVNAILPVGFSRTNAEGGAFEGSEIGEFFRKHLPADAVANAAAFLVSDDCPVTGQCFSVGGGRVARVVFAEPRGFWSPNITPEQVRDNWSAVMGGVDADDDTLRGFQEVISLDHEFEMLAASGVGSNDV